jgi:hypothetical protein
MQYVICTTFSLPRTGILSDFFDFDRKCTMIFLPFSIPSVVAKGKNNIYKYDMIKSKSEYGSPNEAGCLHWITGREPED